MGQGVAGIALRARCWRLGALLHTFCLVRMGSFHASNWIGVRSVAREGGFCTALCVWHTRTELSQTTKKKIDLKQRHVHGTVPRAQRLTCVELPRPTESKVCRCAYADVVLGSPHTN